MKNALLGTALLVVVNITNAAPIIYTDEALYLDDMASFGYSAISESFEDGTAWADSRNSIVSPGNTPAVTSQGIVWTSNFPQNNIATGTVGGAPDGAFAIYSIPHGLTLDSGLYCDSAEDPDIPIECYQNDGLKVKSETGDALYAFGGRIDTANSGKVTFLLDGVDINSNGTDNIDNWQREGEFADNWGFIGVIDVDGFFTAELRELRGKDSQQVLLFADDFTIHAGPPIGPVDISGTIKTTDGVDVCAMVLASGQFMFSCNPLGVLLLENLPRESDGTVKRQIYADGLFPKIDVLTASTDEAVVMTRSGACPSYNAPANPGFFPDVVGDWINISGKVLLQNSQTPVCAMVLANGQHMFSCDGTGSYALNIPLDTNGQFKLQVYADGFAPTTQTFDEFQVINDVRMARAVECQ
jgi:hypothetical protein